MNGMVMVPKSPGWLAVGVVVVLVLPRVDEVLCPSIERCTGVAPMKMDR